MSNDLENITAALVTSGKGILAADESVPTLTRRFATLEIPSTEETRRTYREMLFSTPGIEDSSVAQSCTTKPYTRDALVGGRLRRLYQAMALFPASRSIQAPSRWPACLEKRVTEGLDGLRERLAEYRDMGARFAKWRAVFRIADALPSDACVIANAHALGRYAALCQEQQLVPIVEPEVLMDGDHSIERCEEVTGAVLHAVFDALIEQGVLLEGMLLKPNMVVAGKEYSRVQPPCRRWLSPRCAACAGMYRPRCQASCSCRAARRNRWPRSI